MDREAADRLCDELSPVVAALGLELVDVEISAAAVRVTVDREGGVDLDAVAGANRAVSATLDGLDPLPGRYTLEVSSPGLERRLRTPAHFARALGETVTVRLVAGVADERRVSGRLVEAGAQAFVVEGTEVPGGRAVLRYADIERARTVFVWGSAAPAPRRGRKPGDAAKAGDATKGRHRAVDQKARTS